MHPRSFRAESYNSTYFGCRLIELLNDEDSFVRKSAINAIGEVGSEAEIPLLVKLLKDKDSSIKLSAIDALGELGKASIPFLAEFLKAIVRTIF